MSKIKHWITNYRFILFLFIILGIAASAQSLLLSSKNQSERKYTHYNNYVIFKQSFFHLIDHKDLYAPYPDEHWDLYKYSPTFAFFFGIFALLPDSIGVMLWNLLNHLNSTWLLKTMLILFFLPLLVKRIVF